MSNPALHETLDPGFKNLKAMVAELGEDFRPVRRNLEDLVYEAREAMAPCRPSPRG